MTYFSKRKLNNPNGFTLAEVLITLVIIGIIAALVIPAAINTYVESSTVSKVKKALSTLGQAKLLAENQNGSVADWDFAEGNTPTTKRKFWSYIRPYISVAQDCGTSTACYNPGTIYYLKNSAFGTNYATSTGYYKFTLADGSVMWFRTGGTDSIGKCSEVGGGVENVCAFFYYDVNGDKAPNTLGRDIFVFLFAVGGVYPNLSQDCAKNSLGWGCSSYIIKNNNMKYLH